MKNNCVFCDRSQFEERIIGETKESWIIATLGQITDGGYCLVVPKRHVKCIGAMSEREIESLELLQKRVSRAVAREYESQTLLFEHGIVGQTIQHAHLHVVPAKLYISGTIKEYFGYYTSNHISSFEILRLIHGEEQRPYLLWKDASKILRHADDVWLNERSILNTPKQYLRTVIAQKMGRPERADWRNMDPELDKKLWSETVQRLKPYFK